MALKRNISRKCVGLFIYSSVPYHSFFSVFHICIFLLVHYGYRFCVLLCHHVDSEAYVKGVFAKSLFRFLVYDWYVCFVVFMNSFFTYVVFLLHVYLVRKVEFLVGSHRFMTLLMNSLFFIFFQRWAFAYFLESTNGCIMLMSIFTILYHSSSISLLG